VECDESRHPHDDQNEKQDQKHATFCHILSQSVTG
jgi:hypothetical protein